MIKIVVFVTVCSDSLAFCFDEKTDIPEAIQVQNWILGRHYQEAEEALKKRVIKKPTDLMGYFGLMSLYQIRNFENYDYRFDPPYREWDEQARKLALLMLKNPKATAWDLLMAGGVMGLSGFYLAHNSRSFAALLDIGHARQAIKMSLEKDPSIGEALLAVGLYEYWKSYMTRRFNFLPFIDDRRKEGRQKMEESVGKARFGSVASRISLVFVDFQEKRYDVVLQTTESLLKDYPENIFLRTLRGETFLILNRNRESIDLFQQILATDPTITKSYLFLGMAYAKEGREPEKARVYLERYLTEEPKAQSYWRKPAIDELKRLGVQRKN